jgi:hypothetical protein
MTTIRKYENWHIWLKSMHHSSNLLGQSPAVILPKMDVCAFYFHKNLRLTNWGLKYIQTGGLWSLNQQLQQKLIETILSKTGCVCQYYPHQTLAPISHTIKEPPSLIVNK